MTHTKCWLQAGRRTGHCGIGGHGGGQSVNVTTNKFGDGPVFPYSVLFLSASVVSLLLFLLLFIRVLLFCDNCLLLVKFSLIQMLYPFGQFSKTNYFKNNYYFTTYILSIYFVILSILLEALNRNQ